MTRARANRPRGEADDPVGSAHDAGLRYVNDEMPGVHRLRSGRGFRYVASDGKPVRDPAALDRIRSLAVPPAWNDVWICASATGHLQATGRDARGRKQYRYHPKWREVRDQNKYDRMLAFGQALPAIRRRLDRDLRRPGLAREKVLATVVRLLETTLIRVGNDEYARHNKSFGLTTMRGRHADVSETAIRFEFPGKGGKRWEVDVRDRRLARVVKRCKSLPGQHLFQYIDGDGEPRVVESGDVNDYLREISGEDFTAKDFRTWAGTVLAGWALQEIGGWDSETQAKSNVVRAIESVSKKLGNTPAICRKSYVHPAVIDAYVDGSMVRTLARRARREIGSSLSGLSAEEAAILALLESRLRSEAARASKSA